MFRFSSLTLSLSFPSGLWRRRSLSWLFVSLLALSCLIYGFIFALVAPYIVLPFFIPPFVLMGLVVWALPTTNRAPIALFDSAFMAFFITLVIWPNYLAVSLPGMPWITVIRLTGVILALSLLICLSVSNDFRTSLKYVLSASPWLSRLVISFAAIQLFSIVFSEHLYQSIQVFVMDQFYWTAIFFSSCYFFLKPGRAQAWSRLIWLMAIFVGMIGMWESAIHHPPWVGHIPWFLKIEDPSVLRALNGSFRNYTNRYRAVSTFGTSLSFAEYIALALPFVIHFMISKHRLHIRVAAAVSIPFLLYVVGLTDARLGIIGCLISLLGYGLIWGINRWRQHPESIIGPALTLTYPVIALATIAAVLFVHRLHNLVFGDGSQNTSNEARTMEYLSAIPKILKQPWGYGAGMDGLTLGFSDPSGMITIDSNYLSVVLAYGVIGFAIYYGLLALSIYKAGTLWFVRNDADEDLAVTAPVFLGLINFLVIKSILSDLGNDPLMFMMIGMIAALTFRRRIAHNRDLTGEFVPAELRLLH